jgi:hypothetical protein
MEFFLSFDELAGRLPNAVTLLFVPIFLLVTVLEALIIIRRKGTYPWKNAGASVCLAAGHFALQAAAPFCIPARPPTIPL